MRVACLALLLPTIVGCASIPEDIRIEVGGRVVEVKKEPAEDSEPDESDERR